MPIYVCVYYIYILCIYIYITHVGFLALNPGCPPSKIQARSRWYWACCWEEKTFGCRLGLKKGLGGLGGLGVPLKGTIYKGIYRGLGFWV